MDYIKFMNLMEKVVYLAYKIILKNCHVYLQLAYADTIQRMLDT